jgi:hypothetical protein
VESSQTCTKHCHRDALWKGLLEKRYGRPSKEEVKGWMKEQINVAKARERIYDHLPFVALRMLQVSHEQPQGTSCWWLL